MTENSGLEWISEKEALKVLESADQRLEGEYHTLNNSLKDKLLRMYKLRTTEIERLKKSQSIKYKMNKATGELVIEAYYPRISEPSKIITVSSSASIQDFEIKYEEK